MGLSLLLILFPIFNQFFQVYEYARIDWANLDSAFSRVSIWKTGLLSILNNPIWGTGLSSFEWAYQKFQQPSSEILRYGRSTIFAHNGLIQTWVETGLIGLLFLGFGYLRVAYPVMKSTKKSQMELWALSGLFIFGSIALVNYTVILPLSGWLLSGLLGLLMAHTDPWSKTKWTLTPFRGALSGLVAVFLMISLLFGMSDLYQKKDNLVVSARWMPLRGDLWYERALQTVNQDPQKALTYLDQALRLNPKNGFYWTRRALFLEKIQPDNASAITKAYKKGQEGLPFHAPFYIQEGLFYYRSGRFHDAKNAFLKAKELEPEAPLPYYALSLVEQRLGQPQQAGFFLLQSEQKVKGKVEGPVTQSDYADFLYSVNQDKIDQQRKNIQEALDL